MATTLHYKVLYVNPFLASSIASALPTSVDRNGGANYAHKPVLQVLSFSRALPQTGRDPGWASGRGDEAAGMQRGIDRSRRVRNRYRSNLGRAAKHQRRGAAASGSPGPEPWISKPRRRMPVGSAPAMRTRPPKPTTQPTSASALCTRASVFSRPTTSSVSNNGGAFFRPHTATRIG